MDDEAKPEAQHAGGLHAEYAGGEPEIPDHAVAQLPSVCGKGHARRLSGRAGAARDAVVQLAHRAHPAAVAFPAGLHARADEPDAALDLVCKEDIREYIRLYCAQGNTVLLATHEEADFDLCSKLILLKDGHARTLAADTPVKEIIEYLS